MKRMLLCVLLLSMSVILSASFCQAGDESSGAAKIVAKVNDSVITDAELNRELSMIKQRLEGQGQTISDAKLKEIKSKVLDGLVNRDLLYGVCRKDGIKADEKEVEKAFQMIKARYSNDDAFKKMLQQFNLTEDFIKQDIAREMAIKKMIDARFVKEIKVTDEEAKDYYEKNKANFRQPESVKASHILIKVNEDAVPEIKAKAKAKILEIKKKIEAGADFGEMAKKYSEGPSAAKGGDLGYFRRGQMVKPFEDAAFALKPGEMSDVVETKFGYHLIKSFDKKEESVVPFEQLKDRITMFLKQGKLRKAVSDFIDSLRAKSTIEISKVDQAK
ncbi:MAG: peptidylprolyl isomerase [Deltaproteobacteria bacterium]